MSQAKIILVAGPTASGKSAFALDLAHKLHGSIINVDALQIYSGLPVLSAQPDPSSRSDIPHFLYGTSPPTELSSAGKWVKQAQTAILEILNSGRLPILVGGTGFYFKALLGGLADIPEIPPEIRLITRERFESWGEEKFRTELSLIDPVSAGRLAKNDRQRLMRAYEVAFHTRHPLGYWHEQNHKASPYIPEAHLLMPDRAVLYDMCNRRFIRMVEQGVLDEVSNFMEHKFDESLPVMKTLGLSELMSYLRKQVSLDEAISKAQQATRNYAKRQTTWFRHQWSF